MPGKGKPFERGNKKAKGGKRPNSGRKPNWFKDLCEDELAANKSAGVRLVGQIARGEHQVERIFMSFGKTIVGKCKPAPTEIISANEFLRDSALGKPGLSIEHKGIAGVSIFQLIRQAEEERGLPSSFDTP